MQLLKKILLYVVKSFMEANLYNTNMYVSIQVYKFTKTYSYGNVCCCRYVGK